MKVLLVGMMIGIPNAHDTRYCSDSVMPSSRRFILSVEFLFDNVKPSDGSINTVEVSIRLVLLFLCCSNDRKYTHLHAEILVKTRIFEMQRMEPEAPLFTICPLQMVMGIS